MAPQTTPPDGGRRGVESDHPIVDPTKNVLDLVQAANTRQDDLRTLTKELFDAKIAHVKEIGALRAGHQRELSKAESGRLDSIRQVDREEVTKTAVTANQAITVLAKQTTDLAQTLDKKVTDTATAAEQRNSAVNTDFNKRIAALELSSSEGKGKQGVADPQMEKLTALVEMLARSRATDTGNRDGHADSRQLLTWILGIALALTTLYTFTQRASPAPQAAPQIIYTPAPPGTQLPSSPPATVPR